MNKLIIPTEITPSTITNGKYNAFGIMGQFPNGKLVMVYREGTSHQSDNGIIRLRTSMDEGRTWSTPLTILNETGIDLRNVGGGITPTGRLIVSYVKYVCASNIFLSNNYIYSDDEGITWSNPIEIPHGADDVFSPYGGLIAIGGGKLLMSWYGQHGTGGPNPYSRTSWVIISSDNGATWGNSIAAAHCEGDGIPSYNESSFVYLGGGEILGLARQVPASFHQMISHDNGVTWINQGDTTFDTWTIPGPAWLSTFIGTNGRRMVACYYCNRAAYKLRVIIANAKELITDGVSAWKQETRQDLISNIGGGYPSVVHSCGNPYGIGWAYRDWSANVADIVFFTYP